MVQFNRQAWRVGNLGGKVQGGMAERRKGRQAEEACPGPAGNPQGKKHSPVAAWAGPCASRRFPRQFPCAHGSSPCGKAVAIALRWRHDPPAVLDHWLEWS